MKSKEKKLLFQLNLINRDAVKVIDYTPRGKVGAKIVIPKTHLVLDKGTKGDGTFAWAKVATNIGDIKISFVYMSNKCAQ